MVAVLRDRDGDGEVHGVPAAGEELRGAERRLDTRATAARVFLPPVANDAEGTLDDVDLGDVDVALEPGMATPEFFEPVPEKPAPLSGASAALR